MVEERQEGWVLTPSLPAARPWTTFTGGKNVLFVAPHPQAATRLAHDLLPHLKTHPQIEIEWAMPDQEYRWPGFDDFMRGMRKSPIPWWQVERTPYDLVVAACYGGLADTIGPRVKIPHGINGARSRIGPFDDEYQHDLTPAQLLKDGKVVPSALVLSHEDELAVLAKSCPQALPHAVVAGCPSFDRMLVSRHRKRDYRRALRVRPGQKLVVVTTTWSTHSLWGSDRTFFERLRAALPSWKYRIVVIVHPFVWLMHPDKVDVMLDWARANSVGVLPFDEGWRAALIAADLVIGDHGSVTQYAAALDVPVLMTTRSLINVRPGSTADALSRLATPLHPSEPLLSQVQTAMRATPAQGFADLAVSHHGRALDTLLGVCFELLDLPAPESPAKVEELPMPVLLT